MRNLAVRVVDEGGVGVLEIRGVRRVPDGEGVARRHCLFYVEFSIFASRHGFFILNLRLTTTHVFVSVSVFFFFFLSLSSLMRRCGGGNGLYMRELNMCVRRLNV